MATVVLVLLFLCVSARIVIAIDANTTLNNTHDAPIKQGWTASPDGRGTLDILWSCILTMFLCSWSILCLNVPGAKESKTGILWRKLSLTCLGILCPELIFQNSFSQWLSARQSVRDFNSANFKERPAKGKWTMKEAFFADMGGFILHTRDQLPFPLDSKQLHYLVSKQYVKLPILERRAIEDKDKVDGLLRAITLCQILWFTVSVIGRWAQKLVVTTAELTTVSFVFCSIGTAFFWWHKPADMTTAEIIETNISINDILEAEGRNPGDWRRNPLEFVNRREWWWSKCWTNFTNILRKMHLSFGSETIPNDRIADSFPKEMPNKTIAVCMILSATYFAILFVAWNNSFPTRVEQLLWRAACITLMISLVILTTYTQLAWIGPIIEQRLRSHFARYKFPIKRLKNHSDRQGPNIHRHEKLNKMLDRVRNNSPDKDPLLYIPLKVILPMYIIGFFYCHARAYLLIADVIELRSLPTSAYATVNWGNYWPHIG